MSVTRTRDAWIMAIVAFVAFGPAAAAAACSDILLVVVDTGSLTPQEAAKKTLMESWGYTVNLIDVHDPQGTFNTAVAANDLAYITEDINSGDLNTKLKNAPIGVICEEANLVDDFGLSSSNAWGGPATVVTIDDNSHYITETFSLGALALYNTAESELLVTGTEAPQLQTLASWSGGPTLVVLEARRTLEGGGVAAGRRVQLPWGGNNFEIGYLTADGLTMLQRSLEWACGTLAHWALDEGVGVTAYDEFGDHHGTLTGGTWAGGKVGGALEFDGVDDYVTIPDDPSLRITDAITIAAWIKGDAWGSGQEVDVILRKGEANPTNWQLAIADGRMTLHLGENDTAGTRGDTVLSTGQWYHVAATWDGSEVRIYVNGVLDRTPVARGGTLGTDTRDVYLGGRAVEDRFDGLIDDVWLGDRPLDADEIAALTGTPTVASLLMVVGNPMTLTAQETARQTTFEGWGYGVNLIAEWDTQPNFDAALAANDVAYVPEDVVAANLGAKLLDVPIGVIVEDRGCFDSFGLTVTDANVASDHTVTIQDHDHYITLPFSAGDLTICSTFQPMNRVDQSIARGGQVLADWPGGGHALVALHAGTKMVGGERASGRRVFLPVGDDAFDWAELTTDGLTIVERSLEWGRGLMAHWKLDEIAGTTAADAHGNYDATLTSMDTPNDWVNAWIDGGLDFDGADDRATTAASFTPPQVGTVVFWMKVSGPPVAHGRIFGIDDTWEIRHITTGTPDGLAYGLVFDLGWTGINNEFVTTTTVAEPDRWYHVAATYSTADGSYEVYLDGQPHKTGTAALALSASGQLSIGTRTGSSNYFDGTIDDLRVSNLRMGAAEIESLYRQRGSRIVGWSEINPD